MKTENGNETLNNVTPRKSSRQYYLDLAKCSAILFMILVHVFWKLDSEFEDPAGYVVNFFLGAFMAAPVFMVAMGTGFALTRHNEPEQFIQRGFNMFIIGYMLSLVREFPIAVYDLLQEGWAASSHEILFELFQGDILQFAGLAMIVFGVLKKLNFSDSAILLISMAMSLIGTFIPAVMTESIPFNALAGLIFFVDHPGETMMCFPFLTWFVYPAFGNWLMKRLDSEDKTERVFQKYMLPCLGVVTAGCLLEVRYSAFMMKGNSEYYHMMSHDMIICLSYVIFCFALCFFISRKLPDRVNRAFASCSNALNLIYLIHWPMIYLVRLVMVRMLHIGFTNVNGFVVTILISAVSAFLGVRLKDSIKRHLKTNPESILRYIQ